MRNAFIGVSSPIAYDRFREFQVGYKDTEFVISTDLKATYNRLPYPTPIFESAYGMSLFFDELWFLSRALCPPNMQDLPFVHFVTESKYVDEITDKYITMEQRESLQNVMDVYFEFNKSHFDATRLKGEMELPWNADLTDRSEIFGWGSQHIFGSIGKWEHVLMDLNLISHLSIPNLELITNRFTTPMIERLNKMTLNTNSPDLITEILLFDSVPDYLTKDGGFHPTILEAREDPFILDFRNWILKSSKLSQTEIEELSKETQNAIEKLYLNLIKKYFDKNDFRKAVATTIAGAGLDLFAPGAGIASNLTIEALQSRKVSKIRHQGFLMGQQIRTK